ncbi:dynein axonemal light chain 1-like [Convolutriloba macropyga]|uniref:dynein axonemal light chain 1-like n=1 Tax=Convolutriloba macropyga TaxID=536237 RepID=UPI003F521453
MSFPKSLKEGIQNLEKKTGEKANEMKKVQLYALMLEKMDASLSTLTSCEHLQLSTNCIEKIANLNGLKNLKILSLGRNNIKALTGLEAVADTLEQLWISYNIIEKLKGIAVLKKLAILFMSNNVVKSWDEFSKLKDCPALVDLNFVGNPLEEDLSAAETYRDKVAKLLGKLKKLDGVPIVRDEE